MIMALFDWQHGKAQSELNEMARTLERFAKGDLSGTFPSGSSIAARLSPSVHHVQDVLVRQREAVTGLASALAEMTNAHEAGAIDAVIAADALAEPYRSIAININSLVKSHIDVKMQVVNVVTHYAAGDFSVAMDRLPGKKAAITEAIDCVKVSFQAVTAQAAASEKFVGALGEMTKQHALGWIDAEISAAEFTGGCRDAAESVNALVKSHINVKMKIVDIVTKYADGDFSVAMDRLPGKKALITEAIDKVKATFETVAAQVVASQKFVGALDEMSKQHALGWIDECIPVDQFSGSYQRAAQLVNDLVKSHINVKMKVVEIVSKYATGDFSVAMDRLPGKKAQITDAIDRVKASFEAIAGEVVAVVASAVRGDFSGRGDATKFDHQFKTMVQGLNTLMETADVGLNEVVRVLGALAKGDLTQKITNEYVGTFGRLKDDSNATVESLTKTVNDIKEAADTVSTSAREISAGNGDLSQRTEEQAASLEETAASMEELTATVHQNTENAKQANELAIGASAIAVKGGQVVGEVVETMAAINASSKKIVDIISVIDGIAFQTNILALNAAVEAARAGEQGRGFAVVAGEVRTLAQRSAAAAKEIKALIGDSVDKATAGSRLVDQAGHTMAEIVASVKRVTDIMAAIASASVEQGSGIEQVNTALTQMDQVTQQNAALVEEIAASAESLEERSAALVGLVSVFTLDRPGGSFGIARPAPPPAALKTTKRATATAPLGRSAGRKLAVQHPVDDADWSSF
jgi:methyl-accepting chemotaxis protein